MADPLDDAPWIWQWEDPPSATPAPSAKPIAIRPPKLIVDLFTTKTALSLFKLQAKVAATTPRDRELDGGGEAVVDADAER